MAQQNATPSDGSAKKHFFLFQLILNRTRQRPPVMTDEAIAKLKKPFWVKLIFRWILLALGLVGLYYSFYFLFHEVAIEGFSITMAYEDEDLEANLSFILGMLLTAVSAWLISRISLNTDHLRQNTTYVPHLSLRREPLIHQTGVEERPGQRDFLRVRSFASSRLSAAMIIILLALVNLIEFGFILSGENQVGNWLVLGGPSLFIPLSFFPLVPAAGLLFYALLSTAFLTFSKTPHFFFLEEHRFLAPWMTEIPRADVRAIRISNGNTGAKYLWVFLFGIHILWLYIDGFHFLLNPFAFGAGLLTGWFYVITASFEVIILLILTVRTQTQLEIVTEERRYELLFSPPAGMPNVRGELEEFFEIPALNRRNRHYQKYGPEFDGETGGDPKLVGRLVQDYRSIFAGLLFWAIAIWSQITLMYAGDPLRLTLYMFGYVLLLKGIKEDFTSPRHKLAVVHDPAGQHLFVRKEYLGFNNAFRVDRCPPEGYKYEIRLATLNFFEFMMGLVIPVLLGIDIAGLFHFVPYGPYTQQLFYNHIAGLLVLMLIVCIVLLRPQNVIRIQLPFLQFEIPIPGTVSIDQAQQLKGKNVFGRALWRWGYAFSHQTGVFILRLAVITVAFGLGIYLAYLNF